MSSDVLEQYNLKASHYGFSGANLDDLTASEYTLVTMVVDRSTSVAHMADRIEKAMSSVVKACRKSPRKHNLMLRVVTFSDDLQEVHGFRPLMDIKDNEYDGSIRCSGMTALFDAAQNAIEATGKYGKTLADNQYTVNGIAFIITDGDDNMSTPMGDKQGGMGKVKKMVDQIHQEEALEGMTTALIGLNTNPTLDQYLSEFKDVAKLDKYIAIDDVNDKSIAKLEGWLSQSISSSSQNLATGQSQPLPNF